jgi:uncharacterized protein (TIGR03067 family)
MLRALPLLASLALGFAPVPSPKPADWVELRRLRGEWVLVSETHGGKPAPLRNMRWVFSGRGFDLTDDQGRYRWDVTLDPAARPKAMDQRAGPDEKGEVALVKAVYALEGDTLVACYDMADSASRPRDLSGKGATHCLQVFKRKKH